MRMADLIGSTDVQDKTGEQRGGSISPAATLSGRAGILQISVGADSSICPLKDKLLRRMFSM